MRRVVLEEHFVLNDPEHVDRWASMAPMLPRSIIERILPVLSDIGDRRLEAMAHAGVDMAVLSNVGSVQGVLDPTIAMRLARQANDVLAAAVQRHPTHFAGFATVPLQDPVAGAAELERAVRQLGMKGVMLFGATGGHYLDDPRYQPFWECLEELGCPLYLHAADAPVLPVGLVGRPELMGAWSWTAETATHALRMVMGGLFERYPKTRLLLGHMGETLPFLLYRLDRLVQPARTDGKPLQKPSEIIKRHIAITTAGACSDASLMCAISSMGEDSVMFSIDYPFEKMDEATAWFDAAPISAEQRNKLSWQNAHRILNL